MSQSSTHGGGAYGLLGTIMPPTQYQLISQGGAVFNPPAASPAAQVHPTKPTGPQITEINRPWVRVRDRVEVCSKHSCW